MPPGGFGSSKSTPSTVPLILNEPGPPLVVWKPKENEFTPAGRVNVSVSTSDAMLIVPQKLGVLPERVNVFAVPAVSFDSVYLTESLLHSELVTCLMLRPRM